MKKDKPLDTSCLDKEQLEDKSQVVLTCDEAGKVLHAYPTPHERKAKKPDSIRRCLRTGLAIFVMSSTITLVSCSGIQSGNTDGSGHSKPTTLSGATVLDDPKEYVGPTTAISSQTQIQPIDDKPSQDLPTTIIDAQGTEVTVTDTSRILALDLYGTTSRIVYELGLGDNLVGRDTSSSYEEVIDLPLVTSNGHQLNAEAILNLAPTVIIADTTLGPWDVILQMRDAGIPVIVVDSHRSIDNIETIIMQVANGLGVDEAGQDLATRTQSEVDAKISEISAIAPDSSDKKLRIIFLYMRGNAGVYYMFGSGSGVDSLITTLGATDVATEIGWEGMRPLTDEGLISAEPDLILMMTGGLESVGGVDGLLTEFPALQQTPAGKNRRIVDMDDTEILSFGPATSSTLDALAAAIYAPEAPSEVSESKREDK